jgi:hypothetical protein
MPFQPLGSINTSLWRYQSADPITGFVTENYVNLIEVKKIKVYRDAATPIPNPQVNHPAPFLAVGPQPKVWIWFQTDRLDTRDPDLTLSGLEAASFITELDKFYT